MIPLRTMSRRGKQALSQSERCAHLTIEDDTNDRGVVKASIDDVELVVPHSLLESFDRRRQVTARWALIDTSDVTAQHESNSEDEHLCLYGLVYRSTDERIAISCGGIICLLPVGGWQLGSSVRIDVSQTRSSTTPGPRRSSRRLA